MAKDINKILKIVLIICVVILVISISGSLIYYYAFLKPSNEKAEWEAEIKLGEEQLNWEKEKEIERRKIEILREIEEDKDKYRKEQEEAHRREALYNCLDESYKLYIEQWNKECEILDLEPDSPLPQNKADDLEEYWKDLREECFKLFGSD